LYDKGLALVVNLLWEFGRNGVVSSGILHHKTFIALNTFEDRWFFNRPFTNIGPVLIRT
jgi:hypothetical protein